ncbi:MAG: phosphoribosylaminoimidazolesuccinocarboxamide synthase [Candidatus Aenigmatarchaeota archaeon]|nr:MAG: phosphoribosylaminoimidazolesuccinocarboxamide synthase [Candidatus Aenigmarchaeota archaeon]
MEIDPNYLVLRESNIVGPELAKRGKVRDVYRIGGGRLIFVTTDRISTHDVVYKDCIPHKGFGLTQTTIYAFSNTEDIVENHFLKSPDPNCMIVLGTDPYPIEVVVRGILTGSAWRAYQSDGEVCGIKIPKGMKKNQKLDKPIITPTTKAETGHDEPVTHSQARKIVGPVWDPITEVAIELFERGDQMAYKQGGMLADTKFEFGKRGKYDLILIDEALTHDSSRWLTVDNWREAFEEGKNPDWIDKQPVRDYSESKGFRGEGEPPRLPEDIIRGATERVLKVYYLLSGEELELPQEPPTNRRIVKNLRKVLVNNKSRSQL